MCEPEFLSLFDCKWCSWSIMTHWFWLAGSWWCWRFHPMRRCDTWCNSLSIGSLIMLPASNHVGHSVWCSAISDTISQFQLRCAHGRMCVCVHACVYSCVHMFMHKFCMHYNSSELIAWIQAVSKICLVFRQMSCTIFSQWYAHLRFIARPPLQAISHLQI